MSGSMGTQEFCEITARCENVPSMQNPPRSSPRSSWNLNVPSAIIPVIIWAPQSHRFCRPVEQYRQVPQAGIKEHTTWSPAFTRVTSGPTASITPAPSCPPTIGSRPALSPVCRCSSEWHIPDALKAILTSPRRGSSSSSSAISHGLPGSLMTAALVRMISCYTFGPATASCPAHPDSPRRLWPATKPSRHRQDHQRSPRRTLSRMAVKTAKPETRTALVRRARKINRVLAETYPDAHCELDFENPFQLLVATVLSAQTTDKRVNMITPALFAKYPAPEDLAAANPADVEEILRPTGFFRAKTKAVMGLAAALRDRFGGEVPRTLEEMVTLPGVGRKTANVVLGNAYGIPGITVDTHFGRLARRLRWTSSDDPVKVEADVGALFPKSEWVMLSHRLIWHGRRVCHSRKPACGVCPVADWCPSFGPGPTDAATAAKLVKAGPFS